MTTNEINLFSILNKECCPHFFNKNVSKTKNVTNVIFERCFNNMTVIAHGQNRNLTGKKIEVCTLLLFLGLFFEKMTKNIKI